MPPSRSKFQDRIYLWSGLLIFLCFLVGVVGFGSPAWRAGKYGKRQRVEAGLIVRCYHDLRVSYHRCAPFYIGSQVAWFEACRILCAMSVTLFFAFVIASAFLHVTDKAREDYLYLLVSAIAAGFLGFISSILFAAASRDMLDSFDADLSWGWALFFISHVVVIIVSIIFIFVLKKLTAKRKPKQVTPRREIIF